MSDELFGDHWRLHPETRTALRMNRIREAARDAQYTEVILEAEELLDEEPEHPEALLHLADASIQVRDFVNARSVYQQYLRISKDHPDALLGLAISSFETYEVEEAFQAASQAVKLAPELAEAHYYRGLGSEFIGENDQTAHDAYQQAHALSPERFSMPVRLTDKQWDQAIALALDRIHPTIRKFWKGIPITLEALPDLSVLGQDPLAKVPPTVCGLYQGQENVLSDPWKHRPSSLSLYTANIERYGETSKVEDQIANTLEHEALDWLGVTYEEMTKV